MVDNMRRFVDKILYQVPVNYWNLATAFVIGGMLLGIGNTVLNQPVPEISPDQTTVEPMDAMLAEKKAMVTVPDTINKDNIFRKQRQSYVIPPSQMPTPQPVGKVEMPTTNFKLVGTIISDPVRIAILNVGQNKPKRKPLPRAHVSGALARLAEPRTAAKPAFTKTSEPQSYNEGDKIFDFMLERVYEDRIELVSLDSGESRVVYLEIENDRPPAPPSVVDTLALKKNAGKPIDLSRRKTTSKGANPK